MKKREARKAIDGYFGEVRHSIMFTLTRHGVLAYVEYEDFTSILAAMICFECLSMACCNSSRISRKQLMMICCSRSDMCSASFDE